MPITWNSTLETGYAAIDVQHKELINAVNKVLTACQQGQGTDKIHLLLEHLASYTNTHFGEEEALQKSSNYPDYLNHRNMHVAFVQVVKDLDAELKQTGPTPTLVNKILKNVCDWLVNHIRQQDAKLAAHLKEIGA